MSDITGDKRRTFGGWIPDRRTTIGGLTVIGWMVTLVGIVLAMMSFAVGSWGAALITLAVTMLVVVFFGLRFGDPNVGTTLAQRIAARILAGNRIARGEARYRTGMFSNLPPGQVTALPGTLANMIEIDGTDGRGTPYTLLYHPVGRTLVAVFACAPDGTQLQEQEAIDQSVSWYGGWIASHSQDSAIVGATVVTDTALRSSEPLIAKIANGIDPNAPEIARAATLEGARRLPGRSTESTTWACVAWSVEGLASTLEEAHAEVAAKLPYHVDALRAAGGGAVVPATSSMLAAMVQVAYDPERSTEIATDDLLGLHNPIRVSQAGPEYFDDDYKRVVLHDGVASMTALGLVPPRVEITENTLDGLFGPADRFLRKRVAVMYRPVSPAKTMHLAEQMSKGSHMEATAKGRVSEHSRRKVGQAQHLERQVVEGAAMTRISIAVTVTFAQDARAYREALTKLKSLLESSSIAYRMCDWDAGPAFHTTLPLGVLPWLYEPLVEKAAGAIA